MIVICENCSSGYKTIPSWYAKSKHHYCSKDCAFIASKKARTKNILKAGAKTRFKPGQKPSPNRILPKAENHHAWKGQEVGYRGLHYWLRRIRGEPSACQWCSNPKGQWANIDGLYQRDPDDFVSLCASCHKHYDLAIKATILGDRGSI